MLHMPIMYPSICKNPYPSTLRVSKSTRGSARSQKNQSQQCRSTPLRRSLMTRRGSGITIRSAEIILLAIVMVIYMYYVLTYYLVLNISKRCVRLLAICKVALPFERDLYIVCIIIKIKLIILKCIIL